MEDYIGLGSPCCDEEEWHPHSKREYHLHTPDGYHLVAWDLRPAGIESCGWAFYCGKIQFNGIAKSLDQGKERALAAAGAYQRMVQELKTIGFKSS